MNQVGFDSEKYIRLQSEHIRERINQFGGKLYLEFGGKLFDDYHAARVLPGFAPDNKIKMLLALRDQAEIVIAINAGDIEKNKRRGDLGITYDKDVARLIDVFRGFGLYVGSIALTQYAGQPAADVFEKRIAALEGGVAALATASGAAAITYTIQALAQAGDHIVAQKTIYGGSYNLLAHTLTQFGVNTTFVDAHDLAQVEAAIQPNTKAVYLETLGNPNSDIPDIDAIAAIAHKHGLPLVIDNTFGTPYLIRPLEHGADIVVHSATKFIGGHGTSLGGIIVDGGKFDWAASGNYPAIAAPNPSYHGISFVDAAGPAAFVTYVRAILLRDTGATISPFNAFLLLQGVETLSLRVERHAENTKKIVEYLANHPQVEKVNHPSLPDHPDHALYQKYFPNGGASIFTFQIKGGVKEAHAFIDHLKIFSLLANVADVKSLVIHPATTTHSQLSEQELLDQGIYQNTIRLSIGTENADDLIADLEQAFQAVKE